jgi:hypothetical protein
MSRLRPLTCRRINRPFRRNGISCSPALPDPVEDGGVAEDDGDTGQHEPENEEELLW